MSAAGERREVPFELPIPQGTPLTLAIVFPAVLLQFSDFLTLGAGTYAIPLFGSMVAILDIVRQQLEL